MSRHEGNDLLKRRKICVKATVKYLNGVSALRPAYHLKYFSSFCFDCSWESFPELLFECLSFLTAVHVTISIFCKHGAKLYFRKTYVLDLFLLSRRGLYGSDNRFSLRDFAVNVNKICSVHEALQPRLRSSRKSGIY